MSVQLIDEVVLLYCIHIKNDVRAFEIHWDIAKCSPGTSLHLQPGLFRNQRNSGGHAHKDAGIGGFSKCFAL